MKNSILMSMAILGLVACHRQIQPITTVLDADKVMAKDIHVAADTSNSKPQNLVEGNQQFGIELYKKIFESDKNQFISPYSISSALAMTYRGAAGQTEAEMARVLHFGANNAAFHTEFSQQSELIQEKAKAEKLDIRIANKLWGSLKYEFKEDFLEDIKKYYGGGFERIDMTKAESAANAVNTWVESKTENKIKNLLKPDNITPETHLILVNAIYFLGKWAIDFDKNMTQDRDFNLAGGQKVKTSTMSFYQKNAHDYDFPHQYYESDMGQWLELHYANGAASMIVFLPNKGMGLDKAMEKLTNEKLNEALKGLARPAAPLQIYLPKWKTTYDLSLKETLAEKMGMSQSFSDQADFSGMFKPGQIPLKIGDVIHKAFVDVSETGTEAAAATAVLMVEICSVSVSRDPIKPIIFDADRPFLYFIRDNATNSILFTGSMVNPSI